MKKKVVPTVLLLAGLAGIWFGTKSFTAWAYSTNRVPVTIEYIETQPGTTKKEIYTKAMRQDGSTVEVRNRVDMTGKPFQFRRIFDLKTGKHVVVNTLFSSKTTYKLSAKGTEVLERLPQCAALPDGGPVVSGYATRKRSLDRPCELGKGGCGGPRSVEMLFAPDLGCALLRREFVEFEGGNRKVLVAVDARSVHIGEPDPSLFAVPDWPEMSPAKLADEFQKRFGVRMGAPEAIQAKDSAYRAQQ